MRRRYVLVFSLLILVVLNIAVWIYIARDSNRSLTVAFLDIGQGDAILIESPSGKQMLVDGGPDRSVLRELPKVMGPFDRTLDIVVETHPDADHIGGLPGVFERYRVVAFMGPGVPNDTNITEALVASVEAETGTEELLARRGMRIDLGRGAYADILYPDQDVSQEETNDASIIMRIVYGDTCFILSGDAPSAVEKYVVSTGTDVRCEVLKAGHHGSRTSTSDTWLAAVHPSIVIISAGKDNKYGHPHEEVLAQIRDAGARSISTAEEGTIVFESDGMEIIKR